MLIDFMRISIIFVFIISLRNALAEIMTGVLFIIIANSIIFIAVCLFQMEMVFIGSKLIFFSSKNLINYFRFCLLFKEIESRCF